MLDWIFEGAANWVASVMTQIMDAISGLFLEALGTDMTAMEEYFPFAVSAYTVVQYMAWALLFLVVVWHFFGLLADRSPRRRIHCICWRGAGSSPS